MRDADRAARQAGAAPLSVRNDALPAGSAAASVAASLARQPAQLRQWRWQALALCVVFVLLQAFGDEARALLRFDRAAILQDGQWWRLLTAHFVHLGWAHLALNAIGAVLCGMLAPQCQGRGFWLAVLLLCAGVGGGLLWLSPGVPDYVGFSGVLYGLFVLGLLPQARDGDRGAGVVLAGITAWMLWQWWVGPAASEERMIGGRIVGVAHIYGYGVGVVVWLIGRLALNLRANAIK